MFLLCLRLFFLLCLLLLCLPLIIFCLLVLLLALAWERALGPRLLRPIDPPPSMVLERITVSIKASHTAAGNTCFHHALDSRKAHCKQKWGSCFQTAEKEMASMLALVKLLSLLLQSVAIYQQKATQSEAHHHKLCLQSTQPIITCNALVKVSGVWTKVCDQPPTHMTAASLGASPGCTSSNASKVNVFLHQRM